MDRRQEVGGGAEEVREMAADERGWRPRGEEDGGEGEWWVETQAGEGVYSSITDGEGELKGWLLGNSHHREVS